MRAPLPDRARCTGSWPRTPPPACARATRSWSAAGSTVRDFEDKNGHQRTAVEIDAISVRPRHDPRDRHVPPGPAADRDDGQRSSRSRRRRGSSAGRMSGSAACWTLADDAGLTGDGTGSLASRAPQPGTPAATRATRRRPDASTLPGLAERRRRSPARPGPARGRGARPGGARDAASSGAGRPDAGRGRRPWLRRDPRAGPEFAAGLARWLEPAARRPYPWLLCRSSSIR